MAAAEAAPLVKVGGLADVVGALPAALDELGHEVHVVIPGYAARTTPGEVAGPPLEVDLAGQRWRLDVRRAWLKGGVPVWLLVNEELFGRPQVYGYDDDRLRFLVFSRGVLDLAISIAPEVLHVHDWHSAMAAVWAKVAPSPFRTLLTLHNLGFQGWVPAEEFAGLAIPADAAAPGADGVNVLELAVSAADAVNTVSPTYAREVLLPEFGFGLESRLAARGERFVGILNGIDTVAFDPASDPALPAHYDASDLRGKAVCRQALLSELGLPEPAGPLLGMVMRLTEQKGVELVAPALEPLLEAGQVSLVVLGAGQPEHEAAMRDFAARYQMRVSVRIGYDEQLGNRVYAGADALLMPSRFEPCGISQMIAMRYGTLPIARATGGLRDTIGDGWSGFLFEDYTADALRLAVTRAVEIYASPARWRGMQLIAMAQDFSWRVSARRYANLYARITADPG